MTQQKMHMFSTETALRKFQINTQSDTIYVNLNYLAELSEYFHILRTGFYSEMTAEKVNLNDVFAEDLVVFLSYVCPDGFEFDRTINQHNITPLVYFSDRLVFPWVKREVHKYLNSEAFQNEIYDTELLVQLCYLLHSQNYSEIDVVFKKIALIDNPLVVDRLVQEITDSDVQSFFTKKILQYRPYTEKPRPQMFFDWDHTPYSAYV
ncbi:BTB domain-containing protein [Caenorhabditis elegans]|uniref:BTB domain-containing protein n=1 Tax=Caenorhabditis elegans TaxID=6239 RepID=O61761_CAEEL|nr:BTB domain-containing protein [Caenorhabditis elegans]CCD69814.1 BTB domain-containing protein [Caenorhabditis elegans]|eukprot:NP_508258.1 Uncharacterized protein CELE_F56C3.9 [Caenorhabditis elegans]